VDWRERGIRVRQRTSFPESEQTELTVEASAAEPWTLRLRIPAWTTSPQVRLNGKPLDAAGTPGSYLTLTRQWSPGDHVGLTMPMRLTAEPLRDHPTRQAFLYGPLVLAGQFPRVALPEHLQHQQGPELAEAPPVRVPALKAQGADPADWIKPVPGQPLTFRTTGQERDVTLKPLNQSWQRFAVYWAVA
jgi:uncharacterized protein